MNVGNAVAWAGIVGVGAGVGFGGAKIADSISDHGIAKPIVAGGLGIGTVALGIKAASLIRAGSVPTGPIALMGTALLGAATLGATIGALVD